MSDGQTSIGHLLEELFGKQNVVPIPQIIGRVLAGDYSVAAVLTQCVYYTGKSRKKGHDGWFPRTYEDWQAELGIPERTMRRNIRKLESLGLLESKTQKFYGTPTKFYRADTAYLYTWLTLNLPVQTGHNGRNGSATMAGTKESATMAGTIKVEEIDQVDSPNGGADAPRPKLQGLEGGIEQQAGQVANRCVQTLYHGLRGSPKPLDAKEKGRYGSQFKQACLKGNDEELLLRAATRIIQRWEHHRLSVSDALRDVTNPKPYRQTQVAFDPGSNSPEAAARRKEGHEWLFGE